MAQFTCDEDHVLQGSKTIICQRVAEVFAAWSDHRPVCKVPCFSNFTAPMGTVLSPDYPEGYGNNLNCVWLIISEPGSRIHLAFNDFDLEPPYDFLTIKDGDQSGATMLGRFSGAEVPSHLTSNSNVLQLEFQADHSMSGRGFNITYSTFGRNECPDPGVPLNARRFGDSFQLGSSISVVCDEGFIKTQGADTITCHLEDGKVMWSGLIPKCEAPCGGHYSGPSGVILSPGWPGYYKDSLSCEWVIEAELGRSIKISFDRFQTELSYDFLEVHDGPNLLSPLIGSFNGTQVPQFLFSSSNYLYLLFTTDNSRSNSGFKIFYEASCGGDIRGPGGIILSPGFPELYPNSLNCTWTVEVSHGKVLVGTQALSLELGIRWHSPVMRVIDSKAQGALCVWGEGAARGARRCQDVWVAECGGSFKGESTGRILSPGYPFPYDNNLRCTWTIEVASGNIVSLQFLAFDTEASHDILKVWDGPPENEMLLKEVSGSLLPEGIHSTLNVVTIQFETDFYITKSAFAIDFSTPCGGHFTGSEGTVLSPNYPHNYTRGQSCVYDIFVPGDFVLFGQFVFFQTLATDVVEIYDGSSTEAALLSSIYGSHSAVPRTSSTQCNSVPEPRFGKRIGNDFGTGMAVLFECNPGYTLHGATAIRCEAVPNALAQWNGTVPTCVVPCGGVLAGRRGTILSPGYPETYANYLNCAWKITVPEGAGIQGNAYITCMPGPVRRWNYPVPLCLALCGGNITSMNGTIYSPGHPAEYPHFQDCMWTVRVPPGYGIYINFSVINTEPIYDYIMVWSIRLVVGDSSSV
uniref:Uncharacterized protein n=1 Tax=Knipowitschia caucasica TaxID=637954 RepID=A0AAV2MBP8_KNICA